MNEVKINVSIGELFDKVSILKIKQHKIKDTEKLGQINKELDLLKSLFEEYYIHTKELFNELKSINNKLWDIEDKIRLKERIKEFDNEFIELARSVYVTNDKRFEIKNKINIHFGSIINEVKSYEKY
jgi:peptidoglycan hydrolase CwlO-like protein